jgi:hypothetical protein
MLTVAEEAMETPAAIWYKGPAAYVLTIPPPLVLIMICPASSIKPAAADIEIPLALVMLMLEAVDCINIPDDLVNSIPAADKEVYVAEEVVTSAALAVIRTMLPPSMRASAESKTILDARYGAGQFLVAKDNTPPAVISIEAVLWPLAINTSP